MTLSASIFIATYVIIITEKINKAIAALLGASLMIFAGILSQERTVEGVDFNTLGLLIGMMIIVAISIPIASISISYLSCIPIAISLITSSTSLSNSALLYFTGNTM